MSVVGSQGAAVPRVDWRDRVRFADHFPSGPFAYKPDEILSGEPDRARDRARALRDDESIEWTETVGPVGLLRNIGDPIRMVEDLQLEGISAQPHHCFFANASGGWQANPAYANPAYANPAYANPAYANPAYANPAYANPAYANPAYANPAYANPAYANPAYANPADPRRETGFRMSTARPAAPSRELTAWMMRQFEFDPPDDGPKIIVLDTGLAGQNQPLAFGGTSITGIADPVEGLDAPDGDANQLLDPAAGHGTFIAGLIKQACPCARVTVFKVLTGYGDGDEVKIAECIDQLASDDRTILNLSFGGYVMDEPLAMSYAIRKFQKGGGVVVASAGNDGTCRPSFPAALPDVVSVGAVGPFGPAGFTNWGPWVRACAPGVDLISAFFQGFDGRGREPGPDGADPDLFNGWATWSGTSFAAPVVAAGLGRMMTMGNGCTAKKAVERVVDAADLLRLPGLGTVVNVI